MVNNMLFCNELCNEFQGLSRLEKGYEFEMYIQDILGEKRLEYLGNPREWSEWLRYTATGYDIRVYVPSRGWIKVECKLALKRVYHSWFVRDWLSRRASIIVCNDPWKLSYRDRKELDHRHIKLLTPTQFLCYITKLIHKGGNKYTLNKTVGMCLVTLEGVSDGAKCLAARYDELVVMSDIREKTDHSIDQRRAKSVDREGGASVSVSVSSSISSASPSPMEDLACGRSIVASAAGISDIRQASDIREERGKCRG